MDASLEGPGIIASAKLLAKRLAVVVENRLELLTVELEEGRERLLRIVLLACGTAVACLLAGMALTAAIVVWGWEWSPLGVLLLLTLAYGLAGVALCRRLVALTRDRQALPETLGQLKRDRAALERALE